MFRTIVGETEASITEKKSKFICHIFHVESVEKAEAKLEEIRKKYHDARHNCFAYKVESEGVSKSSDDGEPSGTAGVPMLNIINGNDLSNVLVIVTRYFGGILLGTGGLVRAYSLATTTAIEESEVVYNELGVEAEFFVTYGEYEEVKYHLKNRNIDIIDSEYLERIKVIVCGNEDEIDRLMNEKLSDRVELCDIRVLGKKYVRIYEK